MQVMESVWEGDARAGEHEAGCVRACDMCVSLQLCPRCDTFFSVSSRIAGLQARGAGLADDFLPPSWKINDYRALALAPFIKPPQSAPTASRVLGLKAKRSVLDESKI